MEEQKRNIVSRILAAFWHAFFTDAKNQFSTRKTFALIFVSLAIVEKVCLVFFPAHHFMVFLQAKGFSDAVLIALQASLDAVAMISLSVYGVKAALDAKSQTSQG
jgi:hypothetical protein